MSKETSRPEEEHVTPVEETAAAETAENQQEETYTLTREQMEQMEGLAKELEGQKEQMLRLAAEYDNYRKRTAKEKEGIYNNAKADTVTAMLPVYDNLERAIGSLTADDPHRQGMEMILKQYKESLAKLGVSEMECLGAAFDPEKMNAVMHVEDETSGENTVVEVFQKGFMLGEKVLRFAMVKVAN
ncbi:MAG: nucleotide exchange factor GrpE [Oscillospiraceae bacterium]|nr:nucleotide exchange factor GrpE [Oscillospiraceae bacterium]MBR2928537.1 nucleotide exchange factor GrpE [Oscillospiraceae bacterium]MBR6677426.1 nucleotide exchange factor GrpE [Oscillospiraceae bacterium]